MNPDVWRHVRPEHRPEIEIQTCLVRLPVVCVSVQALITVRNLSIFSQARGVSQSDEGRHYPLPIHRSVRCQVEGKGPNLKNSSHHTHPDRRVSQTPCLIEKLPEYKHRKDEIVKSFARGSGPTWKICVLTMPSNKMERPVEGC